MNWVNKYKVVRRAILTLVCCLITYATWRVFGPAKVVATSEYVALLGLLGVATSFYMKWRKEEDQVDDAATKAADYIISNSAGGRRVGDVQAKPSERREGHSEGGTG